MDEQHIHNEKPVQGQNIAQQQWITQNFYPTQDKVPSSTQPKCVRDVPATPSLSSIQRQNRERLLKRVRTIWIEGLLEQPLHRAAWIGLHLQEQPDALENPWRLEVQELNRAPYPLPVGTSIVEVYNEAKKEMLILGEPGAGKTTLLLELTRTLLEQAEKDEQLPMPIVFNLSSWAEKRQPLRLWLVEELSTKYHVPRKIGKDWVEADQVQPLLDGLDEVAKEERSTCLQQINDYHQSRLGRGSSPIVVCCRREEYTTLSTRVIFQRAVSILPLTNDQINIYLEQAGEQVKGLKQALDEDVELHSLARQPLMLNIFLLAYQGVQASEVTIGETRKEARHTIFTRYVERMLERRKQSKRWKEEQVIQWLTFLAKQMHQHNQTVFSVENLQPDWLSDKQQCLYRWSVKLLFGLVGWLLFGLGIGIGMALGNGLLFGLGVGLLCGPVGGILFGWGFRVDNKIQPTEFITWSWKDGRKRLLIDLAVGIFFGLVVGMPFGLLFELGAGPGAGLRVGLSAGLLFGLGVGLFSWLFGIMSKTQLTKRDHLVPNQGIWRSAQNSLVVGLFSGSVLGLIVGVFSWLFFDTGGPLVRPLGGLVLGLASGLAVSKIQLAEKDHFAPNQGIWLLARNGLIVGLLGTFGWLAIELLSLFGIRMSHGLVGVLGIVLGDGLIGMLIFGLAGALNFGLSSFIHHFLLRFFLWHNNCLPWNLIPFLDEVATRLLLHKVGGSYIFIHRLLLEYFASLKTFSLRKEAVLVDEQGGVSD